MKGFYEGIRKKLSIILALVLIIQIVIPSSLSYANADSQITGKDLGNIFTEIKLLVDGKEIGKESFIEFDKDKTVVEIEFKWEIPNDVNVNAGDGAKISLPASLAFLTDASGDLIGPEDIGVVGTYTLKKLDKSLLVLFNDSLKDKDDKKGFVKFAVTFDLNEFQSNTTQIVKFNEPINKEFKITLKPQGSNTAISKFGKPDAEINAKNINWEIDVNTPLDAISNAIVTDVIPEGLELNSGSIEVYNLLVGYSGNKTQGSKVSSISPEITADGFKINLGEINSAFRIKYSTKIKDYSKASYTNDAKLYNGETELGNAKSTVNKIVRGSSIEKSGQADKGINATKVTWTIDINKSETEIKGAKVSDTLGLFLKPAENIKIYELNKSGSSWVNGADRTEDLKAINDGNIVFPINLGDINRAYRIVFDTDIEYDATYSKTIKLENTAILEGSDIEKGEVTASVTVIRDTLLEKSGAPIVSYNTKEIKWTVHVNKANHNITNAVISDTFGTGHEFKAGSLKVFGTDGKEVAVDENGYPKKTENTNGFKVELGNINSYYKIEYTTIITDYNQGNYTNSATLEGGGVPVGTTVNPGKTVSINNSYTKSNASGTFGGINYDGTNYDAKTMSWKVTIKPTKGKITALTITDTFPSNGMLFLPDTLRVLKGSTVLVMDTDYTVTLIDGESHKGFILTFTGALPLKDSDYNIYYKTSFDPDKVVDAGGTLNSTNKYTNKAEFQGKMEYPDGTETPITGNSSYSYNIIDNSYNSGKKEGTLRRDAREIDWKVFVNYMSRKLDSFIVEDTLSEGQEFMESTLVVREYSVNANGSIDEKDMELQKGTDYTVEKTTGGFKLTFIRSIDKPYIIKYTSKITGISKDKYTNEAIVTGGGKYQSTVTYSDYNKFISKDAVNVSDTRVYTDDVINWMVTLNQSLSEIDNAIFTDTISKGLEYVNDSLKLYKVEGAAKALVTKDQYTLENKLLDNGDRELKLKFSGKIEKAYTVEYDTVVIATAGKVKNNAAFSGDMIETVPTMIKEYSATQVSSGGGSGVTRGKVQVVKVDGNDEATMLNAEFELFYLLNGEKRIIGGGKKATNGGVFEFTNLPLRTYYLREVTAPEGYELNPNPIQITLDSSVKIVKETVKNYKLGSLSIKKVDDKDNLKLLKGAEFKLTNQVTGIENILTTDSNGQAKIDNLAHGKYKLKEIKAPEGYSIDNTERTITIDNDNINIELTLTNTQKPIIVPPVQNYGSIAIKKVDSMDETKTLEGAIFEIKDNSGRVVATLTTDGNGTAKAEKLPFGEYTITEVKAPAGYKLAIGKSRVTISNYSINTEVKVLNEKEVPVTPVDPDKPTKPVDPGKPTEPVDPGKPTIPVDPGKPTVPQTNPKKPEDETDDLDTKIPFGDTDTLPKTGEAGSIGLYLSGLLIASFGAALRKKKK